MSSYSSSASSGRCDMGALRGSRTSPPIRCGGLTRGGTSCRAYSISGSTRCRLHPLHVPAQPRLTRDNIALMLERRSRVVTISSNQDVLPISSILRGVLHELETLRVAALEATRNAAASTEPPPSE